MATVTLKSKKSAGNVNFKILCFRDYPLFFFFFFFFNSAIHYFGYVSFTYLMLTYLSFPNSNFPGPFLRKLPLIHDGMVPLMVVEMGSGVSSTERTRGARLSSPLAFGHRCLLVTEGRGERGAGSLIG